MEVTVQARSDDYVTHSDNDDNDEGNEGQIPGDLLLMMIMSTEQGAAAPGKGRAGQCKTSADCASRVGNSFFRKLQYI